MPDIVIGNLLVRVGADAEDLLKDLKKADAGLSSFNRGVKTAHAAALAFATAASTAAAAVSALVLAATKNADAMQKMAQGAGLATSTFSQLAYAARLSGVSTEQFSTALARLNRNVSDAAAGTGEALNAFRDLGIETVDANGALKSADQIMAEVADQFAGMRDGARKSADAVMIFGRAGAQMIPMLNGGAAGLQALRQEAIDLGVAIDSETGKAAERFNDNLERLQQAGQGAANQLMAELLPALEAVTNQLVDAAKASGKFHDDIKGAADFVQTAALTVFQTLAVVGSDVAFTFRMIGGELGVWVAQLAALARGDFKGFRLISEEWTKDAAQARKDLDDFQKRVLAIKEVHATPTEGVGAFDQQGMGFLLQKKDQGRPENVAKSQSEADALAKQLEEGRKEEDRIQSEALAATVKYRDAQLAKDKEYVDNRNAILIAAYEAEQAAAIADGEVLLENDAVSHSTRLQAFIEANDAELAENERYRQAVQDLEQTYTDAELEALGGMHAVKEQMEQQHQQRLLDIRSRALTTAAAFTKAGYMQQAKTIFGELASITAGVSQHNRQLFELNKVAGIANAVINAYEGISLTMSKYPYPLNIAMAAAHAAAAFAQVSAIQGASFGGGGGAAPSLAGGTAAPPVSPVEAAPAASGGGPTTVIHLQGDTFGRKQLQELFEQINEAQRDGGRILLA